MRHPNRRGKGRVCKDCSDKRHDGITCRHARALRKIDSIMGLSDRSRQAARDTLHRRFKEAQ